MKNKTLQQILESIKVMDSCIQIDKLIFPIKELIGQGYHKQVFEIDDKENNKVIKIIRKDSLNLESALFSFQQIIERQNILGDFGVNYAKIISFDKNGPPYRFLIQEKIPKDGISAVELIKNKTLDENDISQMAKIINKFELGKKWQIDTSPFNWFRVNGQMICTDGSVYKYDEKWSFKNVGLLQWLDSKFIFSTDKQSTKIPSVADAEKLSKEWESLNTKEIKWWKKYLDPKVQPKS